MGKKFDFDITFYNNTITMQQIIQPVKGIYQLLIVLSRDRRMVIGALGERHFAAGLYIYTGSAQRGLQSRLARHLRPSAQKKFHWHIDYFLVFGRVAGTLIFPDFDKARECLMNRSILEILGEEAQAIESFGSSDCSCQGHLIHLKNEIALEKYCTTIQKFPERPIW